MDGSLVKSDLISLTQHFIEATIICTQQRMGGAQGSRIMAIQQTIQLNVDPPLLKLAARGRQDQT